MDLTPARRASQSILCRGDVPGLRTQDGLEKRECWYAATTSPVLAMEGPGPKLAHLCVSALPTRPRDPKRGVSRCSVNVPQQEVSSNWALLPVPLPGQFLRSVSGGWRMCPHPKFDGTF